MRPTLTELYNRALSDVEARLGPDEAALPGQQRHVLAAMHAGAVHGLYGHIDRTGQNLHPETCDEATLPMHGNRVGVNRQEASAAVGTVGLTGANGVTLPAGHRLRGATGQIYTTDTDATIVAGVANVGVTAEKAGAAGNAAAGAGLSLVTTYAGIYAQAIAPDGLAGGADEESLDAWRARICERWRKPPHGGRLDDYVLWAKEISGVTRAWAYTGWAGAGSVGVIYVLDDQAGTLVPNGAHLAAMQTHLDALAPAGATVAVVAPVEKVLNLTIQVSPATVAVKAAVEAALKAMLTVRGGPGGSIRLDWIHEAISGADAEDYHLLTYPAADFSCAANEIPVLGTITWA